MAYENNDLNLISIKQSSASKYGYSEITFVDESGNEIILPDSNTTNFSPNMFSEETTNIPSKYDSREHGVITSAKHQGTTGSCWSFSAMSALESDSLSQNIVNKDVDFSEAHHVWFSTRPNTSNSSDPTYGDGTNSSAPYDTGGNWLVSLHSLSKWSGIANDSDYKFNYSDVTKMGNYAESKRYDTNSGVVVKSAECLSSISMVKEWIMEHGSTTASIYMATSYLYNKVNYYYNVSTSISHQIVIVGWDDNYSKNNFNPQLQPPGNGAWLCKNSWGETFGNNGFFWVSYYDTSLGSFVGFTAQPANQYRHNYTYNGAGWGGLVTNQGSAKVANVFKAKENELLSAVSTYSPVGNQKVNISVYTNLPSNYSSPVQGSRSVLFTTTIEKPGYHTISLPKDIALQPNSYFSIVIELVNPNGTTYIPIENNTNGVTFSSKTKQSYVYFPQYSDSWKSTSYFGVHNVCVQAFTKCNHVPVSNITIAQTCTQNGLEETVCSQCSEKLSSFTLYATGHAFSKWSEYTKNNNGTQTKSRICQFCGYKEEVTESITHSSNNIITITELMDYIFEMFRQFINSLFQNGKGT